MFPVSFYSIWNNWITLSTWEMHLLLGFSLCGALCGDDVFISLKACLFWLLLFESLLSNLPSQTAFSKVFVAYQSVTPVDAGKTVTFMCLFQQPGLMADLQGVSWGPGVSDYLGCHVTGRLPLQSQSPALNIPLPVGRIKNRRRTAFLTDSDVTSHISVFANTLLLQTMGKEQPEESL